jgi:hypothetical protein
MCDSGLLSSSAWQSTDPDSLRWAKEGQPILGGVVPIGSSVRAEIVAALMEPTRFRIWRSTSLLARLFAPIRRPRPALTLDVRGWEHGVVYSESFDTGAATDPKPRRYQFDPDTDRPRSPELVVVPHTNIERSGGVRAIWSTEVTVGHVPASAGTKLQLGSDRSTRVQYELTAAVDPELRARVLVPWGGEYRDVAQYVADSLSTEAAEIYAGEPDDYRGAARDFYRALTPDENAPAEFGLEEEGLFMEEGERRELAVTVRAERPGLGLFAIELTDGEGRSSTSDPWLYSVSDDCGSMVVYDAVVRSGEDEPGTDPEAGRGPVDPEGASGLSLSIPTDGIIVEVELGTIEANREYAVEKDINAEV